MRGSLVWFRRRRISIVAPRRGCSAIELDLQSCFVFRLSVQLDLLFIALPLLELGLRQ